jgi:hypothetical protein
MSIHRVRPACSTSIGVAKKVVKDWKIKDHRKHWDSLNVLIQRPSVKELLKLNRNQLQWVAGLLTEHCHQTGHLFKQGLVNNPRCKRCLEKAESVTYIL